MQKFAFIRNKASKVFKKYGYEEIQPNLLEHEEVFLKSLGETNEIIQKVQLLRSLISENKKGNVSSYRSVSKKIGTSS